MSQAVGLLVIFMLAVMSMRLREDIALAVPVISLILLPIWYSPSLPGLGHVYPPGVAMLAFALRHRTIKEELEKRTGLKRLVMYLAMIFLIVAALICLRYNVTTVIHQEIFLWIPAFAYGLSLNSNLRVEGVYAVLRWSILVLAVGAVAERYTGVHLNSIFPVLDPGQAGYVGYQGRGGSIRAEVTWGQSIALGGALSVGTWLWLQRSKSTLSISATALCVLGALASGSRSALIGSALAAIFALGFNYRTTVLSRTAAAASVLGALLASSFGLFSANSSDVAADYSASDAYRKALFNQVTTYSDRVGPSPYLQKTIAGIDFRGFAYLDNTLADIAVYLGLVAAGLLACLAVAILAALILQRGDRLTLVMLQLPVLSVAAFFTQHQLLVWFLLGLGLSRCADGNRPSPGVDEESSTPGRTHPGDERNRHTNRLVHL